MSRVACGKAFPLLFNPAQPRMNTARGANIGKDTAFSGFKPSLKVLDALSVGQSGVLYGGW